MSKFKKILILTLMLALTLTAFAVVSLAAAEPQAVNVGGHKTDTTFETFTVGAKPFTLVGSGGTNGGIFISEAYPGGNKYLELIGSTGASGTTRYSTFIADDYGRRTTYTLGNYPIVAIDFDIMSSDGKWGLYNDPAQIANNASLYFKPYVEANLQDWSFDYIKLGQLGLSEEKGLWQHLTIVFEFSYSNYGEALISQRVYLNGKPALEYAQLNMSIKYPKIDASKIFIGPIYFQTSRYQAVNHQAIDNIQFTYFEPGYDASKVPTYIYNDSYEFPYGTTVARIGKGYYDSISKAIEAAKPGDVIRLVSDIEEVVNIDKTVVIDTKKYDADGKPIDNEFYSIKTSSTTLVSSAEDGFISFKQVQNASLQIYWDDCPGAAMGGECACPDVYLDENGKHIMEAFTPSAMLNSIPIYPGEIPEFPMVGATEKRFVGWSLEQGGKPIELTPITLEQISDGWLSLYPVYEQTDNPLYAPTEVTFKDFNGNIISTVTANQNKPLVTPSVVALGDGFRAVTNPTWINEADGTALGATLGSEASYVFKATLPETPVYEANLTVAMMNMAYYSGFTYNVYLPKTDDAEFISVCGEVLSGVTVFIEGKEYYLYTVSVDPTGALDDLKIEVKYSVDGAEYTEEFVLSAYLYALGSMESDKHTDEDKAASAALIKYIEELYKYVAGGEALSAEIMAKLDSFYAKYPSQPYATEYPESEVCELDGEVMDEYIKSVYFRISKGSRIGLAVELTDEALAAGYTLKVNGADFDVVNGGLFYTASLPVYLTLMNPVYEIDILDADGAGVATIEYSMATYITSMEDAGYNVDMVKALYAFGKATLAVRNSIFNS